MEHSDLTIAFADATLHRIGSLKAHIAKHGKGKQMKIITLVSAGGFCAIKHRISNNPFKVVTPGPPLPFVGSELLIVKDAPGLRAVTFTVHPHGL